MRGRYPAGWEYMDQFEASDEAKERFQVTVEILMGACRVQEACARLGIGSSRLEQVRHDVVAGALAGEAPQSSLVPHGHEERGLPDQHWFGSVPAAS